MNNYYHRRFELNSFIINNYNQLINLIAFGSEKAKTNLKDSNTVEISFFDLASYKKSELFYCTNKMTEDLNLSSIKFNFNKHISLQETIKDDYLYREIKYLIEITEEWKSTISLPSSIFEIFKNETYELGFKGTLNHFINDITSPNNIKEISVKKEITVLINNIELAIKNIDETLLKSNNLPPHLIETFSFLKKEYIDSYNMIYEDINYLVKDFYQFDMNLINSIHTVLKKDISETFYYKELKRIGFTESLKNKYSKSYLRIIATLGRSEEFGGEDIRKETKYYAFCHVIGLIEFLETQKHFTSEKLGLFLSKISRFKTHDNLMRYHNHRDKSESGHFPLKEKNIYNSEEILLRLAEEM